MSFAHKPRFISPDHRVQAAGALDRAANWLERHEWIQNYAARKGTLLYPDVFDVDARRRAGDTAFDACCAAGAIMLQTGLGDTYELARDTVCESVAGWTGIAQWNDYHERTKDQVVERLHQAADELRKAAAIQLTKVQP